MGAVPVKLVSRSGFSVRRIVPFHLRDDLLVGIGSVADRFIVICPRTILRLVIRVQLGFYDLEVVGRVVQVTLEEFVVGIRPLILLVIGNGNFYAVNRLVLGIGIGMNIPFCLVVCILRVADRLPVGVFYFRFQASVEGEVEFIGHCVSCLVDIVDSRRTEIELVILIVPVLLHGNGRQREGVEHIDMRYTGRYTGGRGAVIFGTGAGAGAVLFLFAVRLRTALIEIMTGMLLIVGAFLLAFFEVEVQGGGGIITLRFFLYISAVCLIMGRIIFHGVVQAVNLVIVDIGSLSGFLFRR